MLMLTLEEDVVLTGLIFERICDNDDCPLIEIHKLPVPERVHWLHGLSQTEKKKILSHYAKHIHKLDKNISFRSAQ